MSKIDEIYEKQKQFFFSGATKDLDFRIAALKKLKAAMKKHEPAIIEALRKDLGRSEFEAYVGDLGPTYEEISVTIKNLKKWAKGESRPSSIANFPAKNKIVYEPYGLSLIIGAWNYPVYLIVGPLVGAICGGNTACLKLAETSANSAEVLRNVINEAFDENYIHAFEGDREIATKLLEKKFDKIFFTGSTRVGKIVMRAACENLSSVTLELGGKSPCIVDESAKIPVAAKRIIWGKLLNCGQTCVAPDYLLVHKSKKDELVSEFKKVIKEFYGENIKDNDEYPRIINQEHARRLAGYIEGHEILAGGEFDTELKFMEPTLLDSPAIDSEVMQNEIFGPILPIFTWETFEEIQDFIHKFEKPLAFYTFSENKAFVNRVNDSFSYGGGCVNDTIVHISEPFLPFGGVGGSGVGAYHGYHSFLCFSHQKAILEKSTNVEVPLRYPPFGNKLKLVRKVLK